MTTGTTDRDPYLWHRPLEGKVRAYAGRDVAVARELFEVLGLVDGPGGTELLPDDTSVINVPGMGTSTPGQTTPASARTNNAFARADDPRHLPTSPAGLRDYEPAATPVKRTRAAAPKPPPKKRAPRKAPAKRQAPARPRAATPPVPDARTSTTSAPSVRPAGTKRTFARCQGTRADGQRCNAPGDPFCGHHNPLTTYRHNGPRRKPIDHGTLRGYFAHYRHRELPVCDRCKDAYNNDRPTKSRGKRLDNAIERARRSARDVAPELDRWVTWAQDSPNDAVRRAAAVLSGSLMVLRVAVTDLARAEARAIAPTATERSA